LFFIIPTATDVPIYHWPWATGGLILANILVFILQISFPDLAEYFILYHGSFNPFTWVSSVFMHANFAHLFGNMCLLLLFGLIVESKVGWWRMLVIYLGIGIASCGIEQFMMIFASGGSSLGASGVIFGLIAVALIWAPENEITLLYAGVGERGIC